MRRAKETRAAQRIAEQRTREGGMTFSGHYVGDGLSTRVSGGAVKPPGAGWTGYFSASMSLKAGEGVLTLSDGTRWRVRIEVASAGTQPPSAGTHRYLFEVLEILGTGKP